MASRPKPDPTPPTFEVEVNLDSSSAMAARPRRERKQTDLLTPEQLDHLQRTDRATVQDLSLQLAPPESPGGPDRPDELPAFRRAGARANPSNHGEAAATTTTAPPATNAPSAAPARPEPPSLLHSTEAGRPTRMMISRQPKLLLGAVLILAAFLGLIGGVAGGLYFLGGQRGDQTADEEPADEVPDDGEPTPSGVEADDEEPPTGAATDPEAQAELDDEALPDDEARNDPQAADDTPTQAPTPRAPTPRAAAPRPTPPQEPPARPAPAEATTPPPAVKPGADKTPPTKGKDKRRYQMVD